MAKIVFIGAGSVVFARSLMSDIFSYPELGDSVLSLMDIDAERLDTVTALARRMTSQFAPRVKVESTLNRREALEDGDYVIIMIQVGGLDAFEQDIYIPLRHGVDQEVGDTLGPGGVFRGLRTVPVLLDICHDVEELCPDALLINYANPMAINCWALNDRSRVKNVGLCHSVQGTAAQLAAYIGVPAEEVSYWVAGINHEAFFLEFRYGGEDAYPWLRQAMLRPEVYEKDRVRFEMYRALGYFITESSHHLGEYVPYFRTTEERIRTYCQPRWFYFEVCRDRWRPYYEQIRRQIAGEEQIEVKRSHEYGVGIIHSMETGSLRTINGNVRNTGLITNLLNGCCVEVTALIDEKGVHPCHVGQLPPQCAALNRTSVNVQELAVKAALEGDRELAFQAVLFDPLTSAMLTPAETRAMVEEMFQAESRWLPQFQ